MARLPSIASEAPSEPTCASWGLSVLIRTAPPSPWGLPFTEHGLDPSSVYGNHFSRQEVSSYYRLPTKQGTSPWVSFPVAVFQNTVVIAHCDIREGLDRTLQSPPRAYQACRGQALVSFTPGQADRLQGHEPQTFSRSDGRALGGVLGRLRHGGSLLQPLSLPRGKAGWARTAESADN